MVKSSAQLKAKIPKGAAKLESKKKTMATKWMKDETQSAMKKGYKEFLKNLADAFGKSYNKAPYDEYVAGIDRTTADEVADGIAAGAAKWQDNYIEAMTK